MIPWSRYRKLVFPFAAFSAVLLCSGLALLNEAWYSETGLQLFGVAIIVFAVVRVIAVRANMPLDAHHAKLTRAPLVAAVDFCGFYLSLALLEVVFIRHTPHHAADALGFVALIFTLLALVPVANAIWLAYRRNPGSSHS